MYIWVCVHACACMCLLVQMNDKNIVMILLEKYVTPLSYIPVLINYSYFPTAF